uniref:Ig-like domain-containing protein n=1 Tax=Timema douglasi TaxID=61478 RepID=A0A7R8Z2S0_TIMDO|nr:unnamed protein product [Timema douglasi]
MRARLWFTGDRIAVTFLQIREEALNSYVAVPPRIAPFSFQTDLHLGDRAGVQCFITKGDLPLKIEWQKDGAPIEADVGVRQLGEHISSLSIESLRPHHAGIYKCQASNSAAQDSHSSRLLVNVPPRIGPFTFGELIEGVRTQVQCVIQAGDPPLTLKWLKDDEILPLELGIQVTQDTYSSTLAIPRVSRMHAGNYTCIAGNPAAKTASVTAQLVVSVPPRWVAEPRDHKVSRDETVMFHCQAEGFPNPTLIWRKIIGRHPSEYQDVTVRSRGLQLFSNGTLYIRQALPEHQGQYLCEATNGVGAGLSALVTLTVHVPPMFEVKSTQATVRRGASQTLQCQAHGDGPMSIVWQREDMRLPAQLKPRYDVKETTIKGGFLSELHISNTVKSDSGTFNCIAKNPFGRSERTVHLQVQDTAQKDFQRCPHAITEKIILYFPIVGHSFIPPDRVFGNLERQFRAKSVIDNPNGYIAVIAEHCTIEHLGEGCPVQDWTLYGDEVLKQPGQWHFQFQKSKKIVFSRSKTRKLVMVQGEPFYGFECGEPKSLVKKGKTFSNARIPEVPRGVPIKLAKVNDVRSLLVLHYGEQWQDDPKLNFYTEVFLHLDSLQPDEGTDEEDILHDLKINPEDDHEVVA